MRRIILLSALAAIAVAGVIAGSAGAESHGKKGSARSAAKAEVTKLNLTPSNPQLAACMPRAKVKVSVKSTTDTLGFDQFKVRARGLAPKRDYTVFLLETAGPPFGAAEYIGDITSDRFGNAYNQFNLIVDEAFSSTLVNGQRTRVELNRVGMWFADPADDDFCAAAPNVDKSTPFDGDNEAGVQAFNSANANPLPAP